jgi:hypothetical protein
MSARSAMSADGNVVIHGAAQAKDAALATASASVTRSYAGKGVVRHVW